MSTMAAPAPARRAMTEDEYSAFDDFEESLEDDDDFDESLEDDKDLEEFEEDSDSEEF